MRLFIFGFGYSSRAIAKAALAEGYQVRGTSRDALKREALRAENIEAYDFAAVPEEALAGATHVLSSIPPAEQRVDPVVERFGNALGAKKWLGYLSTIGVYGDHQGGWVDEETPVQAQSERLERRVAAEQAWRQRGAHIFRLAGIYGPGRSAIDEVLARSARRIFKEGQVFSRIHVEDIASVVLASMAKPNPGAIYNVCDDEAAPSHKVVEYACELLGKTPPPLVPFAQAELSSMGREFYSANRRVRNDKIKRELGVSLRYPTYREGLEALAHQHRL